MDSYVKYRLETSAERLCVAKELLDNKHYRDSINRSYYAIFSTLRALLATRRVDFAKHSAVIGYFRREYIKTKIFDTKFSDYVGEAFNLRNDCDYEDFVIVTREDAQNQYGHARELYELVKKYLEDMRVKEMT